MYYHPLAKMSHTSIYGSTSSLKKYSLTLRPTAPDTPTALRIIREKASRLTDRSSEEMKSPLSGTTLHYIDPFSPDEVDQRMKERNVVQRSELLEKVNSDWILPLSICLLTRSRNLTNSPSKSGSWAKYGTNSPSKFGSWAKYGLLILFHLPPL